VTKPTRISVVVPTLDTRDLTKACVDAVLASHLPEGTELEVVVVDDGSRDGTAEVLLERHGVRVLRNDEPAGYARAVNRGVAETTGELLVLLNSDTELEPGSLACVVEAFAAEDDVGIVGATLWYPDGTPQWSAGHEPSLLWLFAQASGLPALLGRLSGWRKVKPLHSDEPVDVGWVTGAAIAIRASVWRELGPFDIAYRFYVQDLDLCLRVRDRGWRIRLLPGFRAVHHHGATIAPKGEGQGGYADLGLLWTDLVLWAGKRRGRSFARWARAAIRAGGGLRILVRRLALPFVARPRRGAWRNETAVIAHARGGVRS
jgi:GT2 family glycosyltransferase